MVHEISRRAFLRGGAVAAASISTPNILRGSPEFPYQSETFQNTADFRKQFVGQGLDARPMSYWQSINFFEKDYQFHSSVGEEVILVEFKLASGLGDIYWLGARKIGNRILYQLYTEYDELAFVQPAVSSELPLSLRELISFLDKSDIDEDIYRGEGFMRACWESSFECHYEDLDTVLNFVSISSAQYPELASHYKQAGKIWIKERLAEKGFEDV